MIKNNLNLIHIMELLKSKYLLYGFLFITSLVAWGTDSLDRSLVTKYSPFTIVAIDTLIELIILGTVVAFQSPDSPTHFFTELKRMEPIDYLRLIGLGAFGTLASLIGTSLLRHHDVTKLRMSDYVISIIASAFGLYFFMEEDFTLRKLMGVMVIALGGYLFLV